MIPILMKHGYTGSPHTLQEKKKKKAHHILSYAKVVIPAHPPHHGLIQFD